MPGMVFSICVEIWVSLGANGSSYLWWGVRGARVVMPSLTEGCSWGVRASMAPLRGDLVMGGFGVYGPFVWRPSIKVVKNPQFVPLILVSLKDP